MNSKTKNKRTIRLKIFRRNTSYHGTKLIVEVLENEYLLTAIKIFCDWLAGNKRLLQMLLPVIELNTLEFCFIDSIRCRSHLAFGRN